MRRPRFRFRPAALLAVALGVAATAAPARTNENGQIWININAQGPIAGRLLYYGELQPRFFDGGGRIGQVIARGAVGWKLSERVSLFQGYAHIAEPDDALPRDRDEERSFQQLSWDIGKIAGGRLSSRTRFEQRWRSDGHDTGFRVRDLVRYAHPLGRDPGGLGLVVSVEPFVVLNDTDWGPPAGFDQLRTNVALSVPLTGRTTMELGYLNQWINRTAGVFDVAHVAQMALVLRP